MAHSRALLPARAEIVIFGGQGSYGWINTTGSKLALRLKVRAAVCWGVCMCVLVLVLVCVGVPQAHPPQLSCALARL